MPIERKALTAAMTSPYSLLWVSAKVPSLGSGASPFSGHFLVPPPATSVHQIFESEPFMSAGYSAYGKYPFQSLVGQIQLGFSTKRTKVKQTLAAPS